MCLVLNSIHRLRRQKPLQLSSMHVAHRPPLEMILKDLHKFTHNFMTESPNALSPSKGSTRELLHSLVQNKVQVKSSVAGRARLPPVVRLSRATGHQHRHQKAQFHSEQGQPAAAALGHHHKFCSTTAKEKVNIKKKGKKKTSQLSGWKLFSSTLAPPAPPFSHSSLMLSAMLC